MFAHTNVFTNRSRHDERLLFDVCDRASHRLRACHVLGLAHHAMKQRRLAAPDHADNDQQVVGRELEFKV